MTELEEQPAVSTNDPFEALGWVPLTISLETTLAQFTVRDLLSLAIGTTVQAAISETANVPLLANGQLIAWAKLDVVGDRFAARITELL